MNHWPHRLRRVLLAVFLLSGLVAGASLAEEVRPIRKLRGQKYADAMKAQTRADLMRADFQKHFPAAPGKPDPKVSPTPDQLPPEAAKVVAAYQEVLDQYPHTEIAAYCALRLAGVYHYLGHFDKAAEIVEQSASEFAGTEPGEKALLDAGLMQLQSRHDPAAAIERLERITKPDTGPGHTYDNDDVRYLGAQQALIRCELELGRNEAAKTRAEALKQVYPQYAAQIERSYRFAIEADQSRREQEARMPAKAIPPRPAFVALPAKAVSAEERREELVDRLFEAIQQAKGQKLSDDVLAQISALQKAEIEPTAALRELYADFGKSGVRECSVVLLALEEIGGPEALAAIKQIALDPGESGATLGPRAVQALSALTKDPDVMSEVLASRSPQARDAAAAELLGRELTELTVRRLGELLTSDSWITHNLVAAAFLSDRSAKTAAYKVNLLLEALPNLDLLKAVGPAEKPFGAEPRDQILRQYVVAMAKMPGSREALRKRLAEATEQSLVQQVLALALAWQGEKSTYARVLEIAQQDPSGVMRALAVCGLGSVGTVGDVEFLERLAASDPYTEKPENCRDPGEIVYPVRAEAQRSLRNLRKQQPDAKEAPAD